jgi:O-antigen ligase
MLEFGWGLSQFVAPVLYVGVMIIALLTIIKRIEFGIFYLVPFLPHQNLLDWTNKYPLGKDYVDILLIAIIIRWIIDKRKSGEPFLEKTPLNLPLFILMIWAVVEYVHGASYLGLPISLNPGDERFAALKNFIVIPLFYFIVVNNIKSKQQIQLILLLMIISILVIDKNFYNLISSHDVSHYSNDLKFNGTSSSLAGNALGVFLAQYSIILIALFYHLRNLWIRIFLSLPIALSYFSIMFLFSRSGYFATVVSFISFGIFRDKKILVFLVALFFCWQVVLPVAVKERIEMTQTDDGLDDTSRQRFAMWENAMEIVSGNPILGAGLDFTQHNIIMLEEFPGRKWQSYHNAYVHTAVEFGLVGLTIYLWIFFLSIYAGWKLYKKSGDDLSKAIGIGLICCVLACMAGNIAGTYWHFQNVIGFYWVLLGLVVRCLIMLDKTNEQEQDTVINTPKEKDKNVAINKRSPKFSLEYL